MTDTLPEQANAAQTPICVACVGDGTDPATREMCLRCLGTGLDPDPDAPANVIPLAAVPGRRDLRASALTHGMTRKDDAR
jgi:hypothetical protein